jgi:hypothetical protein
MSSIDRVVISDTEYSSSFQGIEVMFMQAECYVNLGQPQKAWLLVHRAISAAQLLGLHRDGNIRVTDGEDRMTIEQRRHAWSKLTMVDRFLSIVLGLPSAVSYDPCDSRATSEYSHITIDTYRQELFMIAGHILERNKACPNLSTSTTLAIDRELDALDMCLPHELRSMDSILSTGFTAGDTSHRLMTRFWHHQLKVFLHLPFALRSEFQPEFERSHQACFSASRQMLRLYHAMRLDSANASHMCRIIDFQAFTAALLLLLGCLGYGSCSSLSEKEHDEEDLGLIDLTSDILKRASEEYGGIVAAQSAQVLVRLRSAGNSHPATGSELEKIAVPYFGMISISAPATSAPRPTSDFQNSFPQDGTNEMDALDSVPTTATVEQQMTSMELEIGLNKDLPHIEIDWDAIVNMDLDQEWN